MIESLYFLHQLTALVAENHQHSLHLPQIHSLRFRTAIPADHPEGSLQILPALWTVILAHRPGPDTGSMVPMSATGEHYFAIILLKADRADVVGSIGSLIRLPGVETLCQVGLSQAPKLECVGGRVSLGVDLFRVDASFVIPLAAAVYYASQYDDDKDSC
jgi:hypothetical protein